MGASEPIIQTTPAARSEIGVSTDEGAWAHDHRIDAVQHCLRCDRFDDKLGHARISGFIDAALSRVPRHHDDGQIDVGAMWVRSHRARKLNAIDGKHVEVDEGNIDWILCRDRLRAAQIRTEPLNICSSARLHTSFLSY